MTLLTEKIPTKKFHYSHGSYNHGELQRAIVRVLKHQKGTSVRSLMRSLNYNDQSIQRALRLLRRRGVVYSVLARNFGSDLHGQALLWYLS